jgi:hypothetical protein
MNNNRSKNGKAAAVTAFITGAKQFFTKGNQMVPLEGTTMTVTAALTQLQTFVDNRAATVAAQATAKAKVAAEKSQAPALLALFGAFETFVRLTVGNDPEGLAGFGLEPHKVPAPLTAEEKAVAAAKRKATRDARGTTSKKQKKSVKGNVTAALVVTPAAAAPPTPAPAEAPALPAAPAAAPAAATTQPKA